MCLFPETSSRSFLLFVGIKQLFGGNYWAVVGTCEAFVKIQWARRWEPQTGSQIILTNVVVFDPFLECIDIKNNKTDPTDQNCFLLIPDPHVSNSRRPSRSYALVPAVTWQHRFDAGWRFTSTWRIWEEDTEHQLNIWWWAHVLGQSYRKCSALTVWRLSDVFRKQKTRTTSWRLSANTMISSKTTRGSNTNRSL